MLLPPLLVSCSSELPSAPSAAGGGLVLSLPSIDSEVQETRAVPSDLKPTSADFHLTIVRQSNNATIYDGAFTSDKITAAPDDYTITASCGENALIGLDTPYFVGTTTASVVSTTEPTPVALPVSVGNALVSVVFGDTEENAERFARFYRDYAFSVAVGTRSASITPDISAKSIYVRAGSTVQLSFSGYVIAADKQVSMPITLPDDVSTTLAAADHLIVTLSLEPNAESAVVTVVKAEVEKVDVEEKVSYNWLPKPVVTVEHQYSAGELVGTNVNIGASFPDAQWEATIHQGSASGNVVRKISGRGALSSTYQSSPSWPYLPPGNYVATYKYYSKQGKAYNFSKTTEFTVPNADITLSVDAYTAHSRYEAGEVDEANACQRLTVYSPSASWNVAASLLGNANYAKTFQYSIGSQSFTVDASSQSMTFGNITNVPVSANPYNFRVVGTFAGQQVAASKQLRITGLPYSLNLSSHGEWSTSGSVTWEDSDVRLGYYSTGGQSITTTTSVQIPQGTKYCADYNVNVHTGTIGTTFTINVGSQVILSIKESGGTFLVGTDHPSTGTTTTFTANANLSSITCDNDYGAGATCTYIYALTFKYGK